MSETEKDKALYEWARAYRDFDLTAWERLPDIELYMDQLINYLGRILKLQEKSEDSPLLTASMVNNYVKGGYIERPRQKKYDKGHIAALYMLCSSKQNLSVPDAAQLLTMLSEYCPLSEIYTLFGERQREIAEELTEPLLSGDEMASNELLNMALDLTLRSSAERLVAERILEQLSAQRSEELLASEQKKEEEKRAEEAERKAEEAEKKAEKARKKAEAERKEKEKKEADGARAESASAEKAKNEG